MSKSILKTDSMKLLFGFVSAACFLGATLLILSGEPLKLAIGGALLLADMVFTFLAFRK